MPIHVPQWFVTQLIAALAVGFLLISDFNSILARVRRLLSSISSRASKRESGDRSQSIDPGRYDRTCVFIEERRLSVEVSNAQFNRPDASLAV